jgi:hypothetical protein
MGGVPEGATGWVGSMGGTLLGTAAAGPAKFASGRVRLEDAVTVRPAARRGESVTTEHRQLLLTMPCTTYHPPSVERS